MDLGYNKEWIELGIIREEDIAVQKREQLSLGDFHDEHMRYKSLMSFLKRGLINARNIQSLIILLDNDEDRLMVNGFLHAMINDLSLVDDVFEIVSEKLISDDVNSLFHVNVALLKREFNTYGKLSPAMIAKFISNEKYHRLIAEYTDDKLVLSTLLASSGSKKIQNIIKRRLRDLDKVLK